MSDRIIRIGHSPDPDDAFMFYGLSSGKVSVSELTVDMGEQRGKKALETLFRLGAERKLIAPVGTIELL